jgi:8-oxo-dGTP pyrophosphatase MutT (NUDIX family)
MDFSHLISLLEERLPAPLPGKVAHLKMSPQPIDLRRFESEFPENIRKSGVLILFYPSGDDIHFPLIKRPEYPGFHSGQVAFPGGKMEIGDENIVQTALREAEEEIGIDRKQVRVLGQLSDLYIPTSNFLVSPVVGFLEDCPELEADQHEVARIILCKLKALLGPEIRKEKVMDLEQDVKLNAPYFEIDGEVVWGATAMILSELIHVLQHQES